LPEQTDQLSDLDIDVPPIEITPKVVKTVDTAVTRMKKSIAVAQAPR
jgi:hypothetical protein